VIHYKGNEAVFPFHKFVARLTEIFTAYRDGGDPKTGEQKVNILVKKMQVKHDSTLETIMINASDKFPDDFDRCTAEISANMAKHMSRAQACESFNSCR
jgi:hypothetical protein